MNLKIGGSNVGKIMYGGQEFGGASKLEPGTILCMVGTSLYRFNDYDDPGADSTVEMTFHNVRKHWEDLKSIRVYYTTQLYISEGESGNVFDVNSIDEPTKTQDLYPLTIHRERSLTDEPDKIIVTTPHKTTNTIVIAVEEWN